MCTRVKILVYRESRRCARDSYPESYITEYTSVRRQNSFTVEVGEELPELRDRSHAHEVLESQIVGKTLTYRDEARVYKSKTLECMAKTLMHRMKILVCRVQILVG